MRELCTIVLIYFAAEVGLFAQPSSDACLRVSSAVIDGIPSIQWQQLDSTTVVAVWGRTDPKAPFMQWETIADIPNDGVGPKNYFGLSQQLPFLELFVETVIDTTDLNKLWRTGYFQAELGASPASKVDSPKRILLLIDEVAGAYLAKHISTWQQDLLEEGWVVQVVTTNETIKEVVSVKEYIQYYAADTASGPLTHVLIAGRLPYAYSGGFDRSGAYIQPDGHTEHGGAWASDSYYGDLYTTMGVDVEYQWTDKSVNIAQPERPARWQNRNVPGDGKYDQSLIPTDLELCVGRLDMRNLTVFGTSESDRNKELELLGNYFAKNHAYRSGKVTLPKRALVDDNFGVFDLTNNGERFVESFASSGYRSFAPLVPADQIFEGDFITDATNSKPTLDTFACTYAYGCGPGGYAHCDFVGLSSDFVTRPVNAAFTLLFGSYFGDVDSENNFMRCLLAGKGSVLTAGWSGRPNWFLHQMSTGATIGESARLSANNASTYVASNVTDLDRKTRSALLFATRGIHILLLGDPSLMEYSTRIQGQIAQKELGQNNVELTWNSADDASEYTTYVIQAGTATASPLRIVATIQHIQGASQTANVTLQSSDKILRVRPVTMPNGTQLSPIAGRGVVTQRTSTSVNEAANQTEDALREYVIYDILGNAVANVTSTQRELSFVVHRSTQSPGAYLAIDWQGRMNTKGFIVLR